jgi:hypothetical protein
MANRNTNITVAFANKKRIRTINCRGSLVTTIVSLDGTFFTPAGKIALCPMPFTASIKSVKMWQHVAFSAAGATKPVVGVTLYGINRSYKDLPATNPIHTFDDNDLTQIVAGAIVPANTTLTGTVDTATELLTGEHINKSVYELLLNGGVERDEFKPYKNDRYGMLCMDVTTAAVTTGVGADNWINIQIDYVDGAPSDAPIDNLTVPKTT